MMKALELLLYELSFSIVWLRSPPLGAFKYLTSKQVLDLVFLGLNLNKVMEP